MGCDQESIVSKKISILVTEEYVCSSWTFLMSWKMEILPESVGQTPESRVGQSLGVASGPGFAAVLDSPSFFLFCLIFIT